MNGGPMSRATMSDSDGNFNVTGLDNGLYSFSANLATYVSVPRDPDTPSVYYRVGDTVRIDLMKGGVITGTVVNASGEPVIAMRVRAIQIRDSNGKSNAGLFAMGERSTDDRGVYRIYGLIPGTYVVQAGGARNQFVPTAYDFDSPTYSPSATRDTAAEVIVRSGEESTADIKYRSEPGRTVSGTVQMRETSTFGVNITLTAVGDGLVPTGSVYQMANSRNFSFQGVADGDYDLVAQEVISSPNQINPDLAMSEPRRITVRGADVTGIELTPSPLASINGKFVFEASKLPECQNKRRPALAEIAVNLVRNPQKDDQKRADVAYLRMFGHSAFLDKDGAFTLRNLRPAQYAFAPKLFARYWYVQSISTAAAGPAKPTSTRFDAARNWTTIKSGETKTGLTITLAEGAASIRGQLSLAEGTKAPTNLKVYLVPSEREKSEDPLRYFVSDIGADGSFTLTNVPPGNYLAAVDTPGEKDPRTLDRLRLPDANETRLKIRRTAESAKVNIELKACQNLTDYKLNWSAP
jgi:hypothetical protein